MGTYDIQISYPLLGLNRMNTASGGYGRLHRPLWCLFTHTPDHMSLWHLSMVTLASVADPWLFDPRVGDGKTYITTMGMQQTSVHSRTISCYKRGWVKQNMVFYFTFVRVYYLTTVERKEFLPGSSLSNLGYGSRYKDLSLVSGMCILAITISVVLLPCAVSSTWTWVNQLLTLVHNWDDKGPPPTYTLRL